MQITIEINLSKQLQSDLKFNYSMYEIYTARYLTSILNSDKEFYKKQANNTLNKIIAIQSLLAKEC